MKNQFDSQKIDDGKARIEIPKDFARKKDDELPLVKLIMAGVLFFVAVIYLIFIIRDPKVTAKEGYDEPIVSVSKDDGDDEDDDGLMGSVKNGVSGAVSGVIDKFLNH